MPVPMIDPIPSAVRFQGPSDRRSNPLSASAYSSPIAFLVKSPITVAPRSQARGPTEFRPRSDHGQTTVRLTVRPRSDSRSDHGQTHGQTTVRPLVRARSNRESGSVGLPVGPGLGRN